MAPHDWPGAPTGHDITARSAYVVVSQVFPPAVGGSGVLLHNIYSRLNDTDIAVLVDQDTCGRPAADVPRLRILPVTIDRHSWSLFDPRAWPNQLHLARLYYRLAGRSRGIVHCGRAQPEGVPALLASRWPGGPPYLFWAHGEDISVALSSRQFRATMRLVYGGASAAIANSRNTARLIESTGWMRGPVHVVYPGVDSVRFTPEADDGSLKRRLAPEGGPLLLSVARLQKRKGIDLVIRALPELRRRFPGMRYAVVGDGPERTALAALASDLGVSAAVAFEGEVDDAVLPAYFAACDLFVLPTRVEGADFEGFGIVYLEAAAAGKPAIGGRNGGVPEAVLEGRTGLLVSGEDVAELAAAVERLAASPELCARLGRAGRARAVAEFTWERAAGIVSRIHGEVASRASGGGA